MKAKEAEWEKQERIPARMDLFVYVSLEVKRRYLSAKCETVQCCCLEQPSVV